MGISEEIEDATITADENGRFKNSRNLGGSYHIFPATNPNVMAMYVRTKVK